MESVALPVSRGRLIAAAAPPSTPVRRQAARPAGPDSTSAAAARTVRRAAAADSSRRAVSARHHCPCASVAGAADQADEAVEGGRVDVAGDDRHDRRVTFGSGRGDRAGEGGFGVGGAGHAAQPVQVHVQDDLGGLAGAVRQAVRRRRAAGRPPRGRRAGAATVTAGLRGRRACRGSPAPPTGRRRRRGPGCRAGCPRRRTWSPGSPTGHQTRHRGRRCRAGRCGGGSLRPGRRCRRGPCRRGRRPAGPSRRRRAPRRGPCRSTRRSGAPMTSRSSPSARAPRTRGWAARRRIDLIAPVAAPSVIWVFHRSQVLGEPWPSSRQPSEARNAARAPTRGPRCAPTRPAPARAGTRPARWWSAPPRRRRPATPAPCAAIAAASVAVAGTGTAPVGGWPGKHMTWVASSRLDLRLLVRY